MKAGGRFSRCEDFEERRVQIALAAAGRGVQRCRDILAEAGTGTGKSIAYLCAFGPLRRVGPRAGVISTNTKNLQEQLFFKDIPLLARMLVSGSRGDPKGSRELYLPTRWKRLVETPDQFLTRQDARLYSGRRVGFKASTPGTFRRPAFFPCLRDGAARSINVSGMFRRWLTAIRAS